VIRARSADGDRRRRRRAAAAGGDEREGEAAERGEPGTVAPMRTGICCGLAAAALVPTPIGRGPLYHPPAGPVHVACTEAPLRKGLRVHLELFAGKRVVIVPAGVGVRDPLLSRGNVTGAGCRARIWTADPTGVVWMDRTGETLDSVFAIWGEPLGPARLAGFRGPVSVFVNGAKRSGDPRPLVLHDRDEIVLEVGGYVPPHASFAFPPSG
jgi:hypothetical protein